MEPLVNTYIYQALVIRQVLKLYSKTGLKPNRDWTPTAMLNAAARITGNSYKRGQYQQAINDLDTIHTGDIPCTTNSPKS